MYRKRINKHINKSIPFIEVFSKGLSFISVIIITRLLSVEEFGIYYFIVSLVAWASVFMDGGVSYFLINKSVKDEIENLGVYLVSRVSFSLLTIIILSVGVGIMEGKYLIYFLIYSLSFLFILLTAFFKIIARTQGKIKLDIVTITTEPLARVIVLSIIFYSIGRVSLSILFSILFATAAITFFLCLIYFKKQFSINLRISFSFSKLYKIFLETKDYLLMYLFLVGLKRVEIIIANYKFEEYELGLYSSADNFYNSAHLFLTSIILVGLKRHYVSNKKTKRKNFLTLFLICIFCTCVLFVFSETIYKLFYTSNYREGYYLLNIISFSLLFAPINYYCVLHNNYYHKTTLNIWVLGIAFLVKLMLLFFSSSIIAFCYIVVLMDILVLLVYYFVWKYNS